MLGEMNLEINNFGSIKHADIKINKINIIAGKNSTGKSTASKLLYSFLRSNSSTISELANNTIFTSLISLFFDLRNYIRHDDEDDFFDDDPFEDDFDEIFNFMKGEEPTSENLNIFYNKLKGIFDKVSLKQTYTEDLENSFKKIHNLMEIRDENSTELYKSSMNKLLKSEFGKNIFPNSEITLTGDFKGSSFKYLVNPREKIESDGWFIIEDVFYIDSFSIFDIIRGKDGLPSTEHVGFLIKSLKDDSENEEMFDEVLNKEFIDLEFDITELIGGYFVLNKNELSFLSIENNDSYIMKNTASGIKQLGIIQLLISNRMLKKSNKNCFLMMDEPEVNLHPEWQFKLAEILVKLAKLDVKIYINCHSPLFIEAMRTFAEKYDLLEDTNFYLTKHDSVSGSSFNHVLPDDLYIIYEELGRPYDYLDDIQISNMFKDRLNTDISNIKD